MLKLLIIFFFIRFFLSVNKHIISIAILKICLYYIKYMVNSISQLELKIERDFVKFAKLINLMDQK